MSFTGPEINKINGGLGRRSANKENVIGLICGGVTTLDYTLGDVVKLIQTKDAEDLGFNASYDSTNQVLVYYHIAEFFRLNPNGILFLQVNDQDGITLSDYVDVAETDYAKKLIQASIDDNNQVKYIGLVRNRDAGVLGSVVSGFDSEVVSSVAKAQELIDEYATQNIFIDGVAVEGFNMSDTLSAAVDSRTLAARNVTIVIGADPAMHLAAPKTAAVGVWLASVGVRRVHESVGSVDIENKPNAKKANENYTLTDTANERFIKAALSNGTLVNDLTPAEKQTLTDKGYAYVGSYNGYSGIYWNSAPTCIEVADDYAYVENNRVWGKAARYVVEALTPKINSTIDIDDAGNINSTTVSNWESIALKKLQNMESDGEASKVDVFIDPVQNVFSTGKVSTKISVRPKGIAREIVNEIGFSNPANS